MENKKKYIYKVLNKFKEVQPILVYDNNILICRLAFIGNIFILSPNLLNCSTT